MTARHGERPDTPSDKPAPTITSKARTDRLVVKDATDRPTDRPTDLYPCQADSHDA
jgi:hypothetical protein